MPGTLLEGYLFWGQHRDEKTDKDTALMELTVQWKEMDVKQVNK